MIRRLSLRDLFPCAPPWLQATIVAVDAGLDPADDLDALRAIVREPRRVDEVLGWRSLRRRQHWFAGRRAAQALAPSLKWPPTGSFVEQQPGGAPLLVWADRRHPITLTHSGTWALAALSPQTGIFAVDFEVGVQDKLYLKDRVCSRVEIERHRLEDPDLPFEERVDRLARIWVLKEALLKAYGVGLIADLKAFMAVDLSYDAPLRFEALSLLHADIPFPLPAGLWGAVTRFEGFPLAVAADPGAAHESA